MSALNEGIVRHYKASETISPKGAYLSYNVVTDGKRGDEPFASLPFGNIKAMRSTFDRVPAGFTVVITPLTKEQVAALDTTPTNARPSRNIVS